MKTNQIIKIAFGDLTVEQRMSDKMFNATKLVIQLSNNTNKGKPLKHVCHFFKLKGTDRYIEELVTDGYLGKKEEAYVSSKGHNCATWVHPLLFMRFCLWLSPTFKLDDMKSVAEQLLESEEENTNITLEAEPFRLPLKAHEGDAAYDLFTYCKTKVTPNKRVFISLGFKVALPSNMALIIHPRSGQSGKGMIANVDFPKWMGGGTYKTRIDADAMLGLVDSGYGDYVNAIVKFGKLNFKQRILRLLGGKFYIPSHARICQGRFVYVPTVNLVYGKVEGKRSGLGSTDK